MPLIDAEDENDVKRSLQARINEGFEKIAKILPQLVADDPASFRCGHAMGYKQALFDIDVFLAFGQEEDE